MIDPLPASRDDSQPPPDEETDSPQRSLERKHEVIRSRIRGAAAGYNTGCLLTGRAGTGKSFIVEQTLREENARYRVVNNWITPKRLFQRIRELANGGVLVLDDVPGLLADKQAQGVLLAACAEPHPGGERSRLVTWETSRETMRVQFSGAVIVISNERLKSDEVSKALLNRLRHLSHDPTDEELLDQALRIVGESERDRETVEYAFETAAEAGVRMTMRLARHALADRRQCDDGRSDADWRRLVRSNLVSAGTAAEEPPPETKAEQIEREVAVAGKAWEAHGDDWRTACEETGLSKDTYYRRLKHYKDRRRRAAKPK